MSKGLSQEEEKLCEETAAKDEYFSRNSTIFSSLTIFKPLFAVVCVYRSDCNLLFSYWLIKITFAGNLHAMIFGLGDHLRHLMGTGDGNTDLDRVRRIQKDS